MLRKGDHSRDRALPSRRAWSQVLAELTLFLLLSLSSIGQGLPVGSESSWRVSSSGAISYDQVSPLWRADFEEGNLGDLDEVQTTAGAGASVTVVTSPVKYGRYAAKSEITNPGGAAPTAPRAQLFSYKVPRDYLEGYFGVAFRLSPGFTVRDWAMVAQLKEYYPYAEGDAGVLASLEFYEPTGLKLRLHHFHMVHDGQPQFETLWVDTEEVKTDTWYSVVMYVVFKKQSEGGVLKLWVDGVLKCTIPHDFESFSTSPYDGPEWITGLYESIYCPSQYVVIDEMRFGTSYEIAKPA